MKFQTLCSKFFWPKIFFSYSCFSKYLMEWQTVYTLIRRLLQKQSDLGLHCLHMLHYLHRLFCQKLWGTKHKRAFTVFFFFFFFFNIRRYIFALRNMIMNIAKPDYNFKSTFRGSRAISNLCKHFITKQYYQANNITASYYNYCKPTSLSIIWADSADDKFIFLLFFSENRIWHFIQIVTLGDNLHNMSNPILWEKLEKNI